MADAGSLHGISQAIGVLQGEVRTNQRIAEKYRDEMIGKVNSIDAAVASLALATANIGEMRRAFDEQLAGLNILVAAGDVRLLRVEAEIAAYRVRLRVNMAWISGLSAAAGSVAALVLDWLSRRFLP